MMLPIQIYGSGSLALLNTEAVLNLILVSLFTYLGVELSPSPRTITEVDGVNAKWKGLRMEVLVVFAE